MYKYAQVSCRKLSFSLEINSHNGSFQFFINVIAENKIWMPFPNEIYSISIFLHLMLFFITDWKFKFIGLMGKNFVYMYNVRGISLSLLVHLPQIDTFLGTQHNTCITETWKTN